MKTYTTRIFLVICCGHSASALVTPQNEAGVRLASAPLGMAVQHAAQFKKDVALRIAADAWLQDSATASSDGREAMRSDILKLLYEIGDPISLAFAVAFVPESNSSPKRPHPPTAEELSLGIAFKMPSEKDMEVMRFATMDDHIENLRSSAINSAIALRKELGLAEIPPPYSLWKTFPKDRESTMSWVLALLKESPGSNELAKRLEKHYDLLSGMPSRSEESSKASSTTTDIPSHSLSLPTPKTSEATPAAPSEDHPSSIPWPVVAAMIAAALGLLWLLLKKLR